LQWLHLDSFTKDSAVPGLSREDAYENFVLFCPIDEQRAIAAFLDRETERIDALITKVQESIDLLKEYRTALISHAVTKGLAPPPSR
jgi:type I restriction enzyme S subunit